MERACVLLTFGCLALIAGSYLGACGRAPLATAGDELDVRRDLGWAEILHLRKARDYFTLRERMNAAPNEEALPVHFARALVQQAFNSPDSSNATIAALLADGRLPDSLVTELRQASLANYLRLFEYAAGLAAVEAVLADSARLEPSDRDDTRNTRRLFLALRDVPPQTSEVSGATAMLLEQGRVPVQVNDSMRHYIFDTGANLSTIMRSEASAAGLRRIPAGIDVGTSTDLRVTADLAVAERLTIGQMHFRHVVFLVLDDSLLTFPGGFRIPGIIGFPVIEQMGEVQLGRDGELMSPAVAPRRMQQNLALQELTPLIRVGWNGSLLLCRLDTGADRTQFYEPFYRRFRTQVDEAAPLTTRRTGGAGGIRELPVRVMPDVRLALGDTVAVVDSIEVLVQSIVRDSAENYLDCNIGHDVLDAFPHYVLNFRDMAFLLH